MNTSKKIIKRVENDLKPHNAETIKNILEIYKTSNKCCAIQATGTGKTFLILRLLEIYNDEGKVAVIFAPNREIIKQTKKRMKKFGLNNAIFYTYQKLARMTDEEIADIKADLIVCDELHRTGAKTWGQKFEVLVETHPNSKVFGVTATPLRCTDGRDMAEEYFDGNKACDISLAEALVREIIPVMPLYVSALYTFDEEYQNMGEKIEKGNNSVEEKAELQKELLAAKQQLEKANGIPEIIKKYITNYNGKYLVFCKDKKHLYAMKDVVVGWFREAGYNGEIFEYPYYSNSNSVKKNLEHFENNKEEGLKLLFIIDKLNEGLHLDEVHGCILLRTTVSNIIYYQQIGRAIDAGSNEKRVILDLVSNFNSLKSFNLKKELAEKVKERRSGKFSDCSKDFDLSKFDVVDCVQECVDVFNNIDNKIFGDNRPWSEEENGIMLKMYPQIGIEVMNYIKGRSKKSIITQASRLGISSKFNDFSEKEINIIKNYYLNSSKEEMLLLLPNKKWNAIFNKAKELGLYKCKAWTKEECDIIKTYAKDNIEKCYELIDKKPAYIRTKAKKMGINYQTSLERWSDNEINIVKDNYIYGYEKLMELLPNRTYEAICTRLKMLKLKVPQNAVKRDTRKNISGYPYVYLMNNKWTVMFTISGEKITVGCFDDVDEAGRVALEKAKEYGKI